VGGIRREKRVRIHGYCDLCGLKRLLIKKHINVCSDKIKHLFCSQACKIKWVYGLMNKREALISV